MFLVSRLLIFKKRNLKITLHNQYKSKKAFFIEAIFIGKFTNIALNTMDSLITLDLFISKLIKKTIKNKMSSFL
jgi:hypothetical protein